MHPRADRRVWMPRASVIGAGRKRLWFWMPGSGRAWSPVSARTRTDTRTWWPSAEFIGEDLGAWMVGLGWALASRGYSTCYVSDEELDRSRGLGIWAGRFVP